jgi:hypothetical protein
VLPHADADARRRAPTTATTSRRRGSSRSTSVPRPPASPTRHARQVVRWPPFPCRSGHGRGRPQEHQASPHIAPMSASRVPDPVRASVLGRSQGRVPAKAAASGLRQKQQLTAATSRSGPMPAASLLPAARASGQARTHLQPVAVATCRLQPTSARGPGSCFEAPCGGRRRRPTVAAQSGAWPLRRGPCTVARVAT